MSKTMIMDHPLYSTRSPCCRNKTTGSKEVP